MSLIKPLPVVPVDIIGDIHGEFTALLHLLEVLGYAEDGAHPEGRQLVFTGDLVDRGPDSPAVLDKVMALVNSGVAHCVLGNHELNILRGVRKGGNDWLLDPGGASTAEHRLASAPRAVVYREFLNQQPFVLEGPHLRVVHACWHDEAIAALARLSGPGINIGDLYREIEGSIVERMRSQPVAEAKLQEIENWGDRIADPTWSARMLPAHASVDLALQMDNPLRVLTTSEEKIAGEPFFAGGKWRMTERARWWERYSDPVPVVIGHFWRLFDDDARRITGMFGADVFEGIDSHEWMGARRNVYCVDYSVGQRHLERRQGADAGFHGKLAALRYPEWQVIHDDGSRIDIGEPG